MRCARKAATLPNLRLEVWEKLKQDDESMLKNEVGNAVEIGVKSLKIRAPGVVWSSWATLLAPRWPKMRFWTRLGLYLEVCLGASWRQDGPRWRQVGQLGAKLCPRLPTWRPRWSTWRTFGSILATFFGSWARSCQKLRKPQKRR